MANFYEYTLAKSKAIRGLQGVAVSLVDVNPTGPGGATNLGRGPNANSQNSQRGVVGGSISPGARTQQHSAANYTILDNRRDWMECASDGGQIAGWELMIATDTQEESGALFNARRPIILNGIEDFVTRGDLADRALAIMLMAIPDDKRRDEETFWAEFERADPLIFGALWCAALNAPSRW
jgi:hypothetical protein